VTPIYIQNQQILHMKLTLYLLEKTPLANYKNQAVNILSIYTCVRNVKIHHVYADRNIFILSVTTTRVNTG
jgi:virulence-associated protein VapD